MAALFDWNPDHCEPEYVDHVIGDCAYEVCNLPSTVKLHKEFTVCAAHYEDYKIRAEDDELSLAEDIIKRTLGLSEMHSNSYVHQLCELALADLKRRERQIPRRLREVRQIVSEFADAEPSERRQEMIRRQEAIAGE